MSVQASMQSSLTMSVALFLRKVLQGALLIAVMQAALPVHAAGADCPPQARAPSQEEVEAGMRDARDHGFLWRISKGGHDSYLYGTVHAAKLGWVYPGPKVSRALKASQVVALEMDALDEDIQRRMSAGTTLKPSQAQLAPDLRQRIDARATAECLPPGALAKLIPEIQIATLLLLAARRDGLDPAYGIDIFLAGWARGAHRKVVSLETPELQLKTLRMSKPSDTVEMVRTALDELDRGHAIKTIRRVAQVWADSDLADLDSYESWCDCLKTAADRAELKRTLDDRNPGLASGIDALHRKGDTVFAAVGSLHMIGPRGLPALMQARGYRVEQIGLAP